MRLRNATNSITRCFWQLARPSLQTQIIQFNNRREKGMKNENDII